MRITTHARAGWPTILRASASIAVCALLLSGCAVVYAGPTAASQLEQEFAEIEGVASVEVHGSQTLPLLGAVFGSVTLEPAVPEARIDEITEALVAFERVRPWGITWSVSLDAGALTVGVSPDAETTRSRLNTARDLLKLSGIVAARVEVGLTEPDIVVQVDSPAALSAGYAAADDAATTLVRDEDAMSAEVSALYGDVTLPPDGLEPDASFVISDRSVSAAGGQLEDGLRLYDLALAEFTLTAARITPQELTLRTSEERDVPALEKFAAERSTALQLDVQGGKTTRKPDTQPAGDAVGTALREAPEVVKIQTSGNAVVADIASSADARAVFEAVRGVPEFTELDGFTLDVPLDFSVHDEPSGFAETLDVGLIASALPFTTGVEVRGGVTNRLPSIDLRLTSTDADDIAAFAAAMKPMLVSGGWHVWINADGRVESFTAADRIVLNDRTTASDAGDREFADTLVRAWNDSAR